MTDDRTALLGRRASLLARMRNVAKTTPGSDPARRVQLTVAMDRFLARMLATTGWGSWILKGGYANQLRAPAEARFTQDVDLKLDVPLDQVQEILVTAASTDLSDLFSYELGPPRPLVGPPGGGLRFPVQAQIAGSAFVSFGADVNSRDAVVGKPERHPSDPIVVKLGYPQSHFPVYPIAQRFAEKRHAFASDALIAAGEATFGTRRGHRWPPSIPTVPDAWARPYAVLRMEMGIGPATPGAARDALAEFLQPVLAGRRDLRSSRGGGWSQSD